MPVKLANTLHEPFGEWQVTVSGESVTITGETAIISDECRILEGRDHIDGAR